MAYDLPPAIERPKRNRPNREQRMVLEEQAFRLRTAGWTTRQIADQLKVSTQAAWRYYTCAREKVMLHLERGGSQALVMELVRLDAQVRVLWPLAMGHKETRIVKGEPVVVDVPPDVDAHSALLGINKARRAMLGLDMPKEVSIKAHMTVETATMIWGFDPMAAFPDPPPLPQLEHHGNGADGANGTKGSDGTNGGDPDDGSA